jgi:glycosyltransferase involved in cell wall biosynthesis
MPIRNGAARVLHLIKTSHGAVFALKQMRELVKLGVEVHVALPVDGPLVPQYQSNGIVVHPFNPHIPMKTPWCWPKFAEQLRNLVHTINPDIIHSHFVGTTLAMRLFLGRRHPVPRIFQVPGPIHLEHAFFREAELLTAGPRDHWIAACRWSYNRYLASGVPPDRLSLSYYGMDLHDIRASRPPVLRQLLGLPPETRLVGMVAYIYKPKRYLGHTTGIKGHEDLIDALALCMKEGPTIYGVFIGGAVNGAEDYEKQIQEYARKRLGNRVRFLGIREDIYSLYPDLDVLVHPSHSENVAGAVVESLLLGVPVVATDVGGLPDLVKNGETGWVVPAKSPSKLAETILEVLREPERARAFTSKGQVKAIDLLDLKKTARQVADVYESILNGHRARRDCIRERSRIDGSLS